jgi:dUTP pyrophosphatase
MSENKSIPGSTFESWQSDENGSNDCCKGVYLPTQSKKEKSAKCTKKTSHVDVVVMRTTSNVKIPQYKTSQAAGCDVHANTILPLFIAPGEIKMISTGLKVIVPPGYKLSLYPRSGLGSQGLTLSNCVGIIDSDYRDEIKIALINNSGKTYEIKPQERLAQFVLEKKETINWCPVSAEQFVELCEQESNDRKGGFGHTGKE